MRAVPCANSGAAIVAGMNNDAQVVIAGIPPIEPMVKGGKLKAIAVFSDRRLPNRPQLATGAETCLGLVINGWFGVIAPKGTSDKAIERVNRDAIEVARTPELTERFDAFGVYAKNRTQAQFGKYWNDDRVRWEKVLRDIGAKTSITPITAITAMAGESTARSRSPPGQLGADAGATCAPSRLYSSSPIWLCR